MKTISVQSMPNGFEIEPPPFGYWFRAGVAFTLGFGCVYVVAYVVMEFLIFNLPNLLLLRRIIHG